MTPRAIVSGSALFLVVMFSTWWIVESSTAFPPSYAQSELGFEDDANSRSFSNDDFSSWVRPPGPPRVGIQAGHYRNDEVPEELGGLTDNGLGALGGGTNERDVVFAIASRVVTKLSDQGIIADLLPATIPPGYIADAFVSIHADANAAPAASGYKIATPRRDRSGKADKLSEALYEEYGTQTKLRRDANITKRMSGYYAFNWHKYEHAIHPMTPAVIIETGFITSPIDQRILLRSPEIAAEGIANGVTAYLLQEGIIE